MMNPENYTTRAAGAIAWYRPLEITVLIEEKAAEDRMRVEGFTDEVWPALRCSRPL